ncbi:MAG: glycosyltransferase family 87 protein [Actinomycetota bacterium]|nr:glycosyltransferase family 87 protein [Actinomycetota bacterium]
MGRKGGFSVNLVLNVLLAAAIALALWGFAADVDNTLDYGGVDLRNRVVGARVMLEDQDPYYYKWSEGQPYTLLDPIDNLENPVSRITVTPTALMLHAPFACIPYRAQRIAWLVGQWLLLLASILLFASRADSGIKRKIIWIIGLFFSATYIWRFHVERGQMYILYVFLIALSFWVADGSSRYSGFVGGVVLGIAVSLRPTLVVMAIPILIYRKWSLVLGVVAGMVIFVSLSLAVFGLPAWRSYASAMRYHQKPNLGEAIMESFDHHDVTIEGMDNIDDYLPFPNVNTSLQYTFRRAFDVKVSSTAFLVALFLITLLMSVYLLRYREARLSLSAIFVIGSTMMLVADFFLPAIKAYYSDIMWLVPLAFVIIEGDKLLSVSRIIIGTCLFLLVTGLFLSFSVLWAGYDVLLGEWCIILFLIVVSWFLPRSYRGATGPDSEVSGYGLETSGGP